MRIFSVSVQFKRMIPANENIIKTYNFARMIPIPVQEWNTSHDRTWNLRGSTWLHPFRWDSKNGKQIKAKIVCSDIIEKQWKCFCYVMFVCWKIFAWAIEYNCVLILPSFLFWFLNRIFIASFYMVLIESIGAPKIPFGITKRKEDKLVLLSKRKRVIIGWCSECVQIDVGPMGRES